MKILICDDHKIVRQGLRQILQKMEEVTLIEEAGDGDEALKLLKIKAFDILLLDISLPGRSGLEVLKAVKTKWPSTNVLMLSIYTHQQYAINAIKFGASGYLSKDTALEELIKAVRAVSKGGNYISQSLAFTLAFHDNKDQGRQKHELLSTREFEILIEMANGKSQQKIGDELCISNKTIGTYRRRILDKMELSSNVELMRYCLENKLI